MEGAVSILQNDLGFAVVVDVGDGGHGQGGGGLPSPEDAARAAVASAQSFVVTE